MDLGQVCVVDESRSFHALFRYLGRLFDAGTRHFGPFWMAVFATQLPGQ